MRMVLVNSVNTLSPYFFKIHFNITILALPSGLIPSGFPNRQKNSVVLNESSNLLKLDRLMRGRMWHYCAIVSRYHFSWTVSFFSTNDRGCMFIQNAGISLQAHMVLHSRRPTWYHHYYENFRSRIGEQALNTNSHF
jgi:hypothetical protein